MGILDKFFKSSSNVKGNNTKNNEDNSKKYMLSNEIVNLTSKINRIDSFDRSIRQYVNMSSNEFQKKSLEELEQIKESLSFRLSSISNENKNELAKRDAIEQAKWTGNKPKNMSQREFDRYQRSDDR